MPKFLEPYTIGRSWTPQLAFFGAGLSSFAYQGNGGWQAQVQAAYNLTTVTVKPVVNMLVPS